MEKIPNPFNIPMLSTTPDPTPTVAQPAEDTTDRVTVSGRASRFSLDEARTELKLNGILQPNRFIVIFSLPKGIKEMADYTAIKNAQYLQDNHADSDNFLSLRCESVQIPGVNFFTNDEVRRYGFGQIERRPYLPTFNPLTLQFVVDRNAKVIDFFNKWTNGIVNYNTDFGMSPGSKKYKPYLLKYRDQFMSPTMRIWIYDETNLTSFGVKLYDAYPLTTGNIDLNWGQSNEAMKYSVVMQYSHMSMQFSRNDAEARAKFGTTPKSSSEVLDDVIAENKQPDLMNSIFDITGKMIEGEIYSGAERVITKAFDRIFK